MRVTWHSIVCGGRVSLFGAAKVWVANVKPELQRADMAEPVKECHS